MNKPINIEAYKQIHEKSKLAFCIIEVIKNQDKIVDFSFIYANPALAELSNVKLSKLYEKPFYENFPYFDINLLNVIIKSLENHETEELQTLINNDKKLLQGVIYPIRENSCAIIVLDYSKYNYQIKENQLLQKTLKEVRQANHIFTKIEKLFGRFVLLDFENDTYQFLGGAPYNDLIAPSGKYDKFVKHIVNMLTEDKDNIFNIFQKENLIGFFNNKDKVMQLTIHISRDGEKYESCNIIPLKFHNGICNQAILTQQDITNIIQEKEKNEMVLNEALRSAKLANMAKSKFLSNISHDLRTPLNTILGMSTIAQMNINNNETVKTCLDKITIAGNHLLQIINQILDMSKIEKGEEILNNTFFSMKDCIDEVISITSPNCKMKNISFKIFKQFSIDRVFGDVLKLKRMLLNLLDNAVKYTNENGNIEFSIIEKMSEIDNFNCFQFIVKDDGIGMDEEFIEHIFEPFARANSNFSTDGAGLGMSIVQNTVKLMNGDIDIESKIGSGTTITVTIYLQKSNIKKSIKKFTTTNYECDLPSKKVLLVEDNDLNIEVAKALLESMGHIVISCKNGEDAIKAMKNQNEDYYDIIFMDIRMPIIDGYQTTTEIRKLPLKNAKTIPIIAMTADAFVENIHQAKKSGMNDYLSKPISINEIKRVFIKYLS